jgi:uncharacterized protein
MGYGFHYLQGEHLTRAAKVQKKVIQLVGGFKWPDNTKDVSAEWTVLHLSGVSQLARFLALKRGKDSELAATAGILHDIGLLVNMGMEHSHAKNGYEKAKEILQEVGGFTDEEIEMIASAVAKHSEKDKIGNWLEELMKDTDILDCALHGSDFSPFEHHFKRVKNLEKELGIKLCL